MKYRLKTILEFAEYKRCGATTVRKAVANHELDVEIVYVGEKKNKKYLVVLNKKARQWRPVSRASEQYRRRRTRFIKIKNGLEYRPDAMGFECQRSLNFLLRC
ncbi:hypothetical protein ACFLS9_09165 [Bacteroidota bacterium]